MAERGGQGIAEPPATLALRFVRLGMHGTH